jgi:hypothetical protein
MRRNRTKADIVKESIAMAMYDPTHGWYYPHGTAHAYNLNMLPAYGYSRSPYNTYTPPSYSYCPPQYAYTYGYPTYPGMGVNTMGLGGVPMPMTNWGMGYNVSDRSSSCPPIPLPQSANP